MFRQVTILRRMVYANVLVSLVLFTGCGPSGPKLVQVTGTVTVDDKPAQSAIIMFTPAEGISSVADLSATGTYTLSTTNGQLGAIIGSHTVQIVCRSEGSVEEGQQQPPPCNVPSKYASSETSDLTAEVKDQEENVIDFALSSK